MSSRVPVHSSRPMIRTVIHPAVCVFVVLCVLGTLHAQAPSEAARPADSGWVTVQEWTGGSGPKKTDVFSPSSRPWRVSFKATAGERWGLLDIFVRTKEGQYVGSASNMQLFAFDDERRSGSFLVDSEHGEYVLEIVSDGLAWHVTVEQRQ